MTLSIWFAMKSLIQKVFNKLVHKQKTKTKPPAQTEAEQRLAEYQQILETDPNNFDALYEAGQTLRSLQRFPEAREYLRLATQTEQGQNNPQVWNTFAVVCNECENGRAEAQEAKKRAMLLQEQKHATQTEQTSSVRNEWEDQPVQKQIDRDTREDEHPDDNTETSEQISLELGSPEYQKYVADLSDEKREDLAGALLYKAGESYQLGSFSVAINSLQEVMRLTKNDEKKSTAYYNQGIALKDLHRYTEAVESYEQSILLTKNDEKKSTAYYNQGIALKDLHRYAAAVKSYQQAICLTKDDETKATAYVNQGNALRRLHHYAEAVKAYEKAICLTKDDETKAHAYYNQGNTLIVWAPSIRERNENTANENRNDAEKEALTISSLGVHHNAPIRADYYKAALLSYDKAIFYDKALIVAWIQKGQTLLRLHRPVEGQVCLNRGYHSVSLTTRGRMVFTGNNVATFLQEMHTLSAPALLYRIFYQDHPELLTAHQYQDLADQAFREYQILAEVCEVLQYPLAAWPEEEQQQLIAALVFHHGDPMWAVELLKDNLEKYPKHLPSHAYFLDACAGFAERPDQAYVDQVVELARNHEAITDRDRYYQARLLWSECNETERTLELLRNMSDFLPAQYFLLELLDDTGDVAGKEKVVEDICTLEKNLLQQGVPGFLSETKPNTVDLDRDAWNRPGYKFVYAQELRWGIQLLMEALPKDEEELNAIHIQRKPSDWAAWEMLEIEKDHFEREKKNRDEKAKQEYLEQTQEKLVRFFDIAEPGKLTHNALIREVNTLGVSNPDNEVKLKRMQKLIEYTYRCDLISAHEAALLQIFFEMRKHAAVHPTTSFNMGQIVKQTFKEAVVIGSGTALLPRVFSTAEGVYMATGMMVLNVLEEGLKVFQSDKPLPVDDFGVFKENFVRYLREEKHRYTVPMIAEEHADACFANYPIEAPASEQAQFLLRTLRKVFPLTQVYEQCCEELRRVVVQLSREKWETVHEALQAIDPLLAEELESLQRS